MLVSTRQVRNPLWVRLRERRSLWLPVVAVVISGVGSFCWASLNNSIVPEGIIVHHAALPPSYAGRRVDAQLIGEFHRARGLSTFCWGRYYDAGYHYVILPDGTVQSGRPEYCKGAHALGYNSSIGICLIGNFSSRHNPNGEQGPTAPTEKQMRALVNLCNELATKYQIPASRMRRHSDIEPGTECPGDGFPMAEFEKLLNGTR